MKSLGYVFGRPPCEVVSWKDMDMTMQNQGISSTSLWGRELKDLRSKEKGLCSKSTSLWGRELKDWKRHEGHTEITRRPPCEVVSWKLLFFHFLHPLSCRPPCEVVSWKTSAACFKPAAACRPPCEVVSWKLKAVTGGGIEFSRPPCEVVSWKNGRRCGRYDWFESTSLWGRELKEKNCSKTLKGFRSTSLKDYNILIEWSRDEQ